MEFLDDEAELSDSEEVVDSKKKRRRVAVSDDEDSSIEGDDNEGVVEGLINDDVEEEEGDNESDRGSKRRNSSEDETDLDEDDLDLIEENLGHKIKRKKRFKRLRRVSAGESDDEDDNGGKDEIADEIFNREDDEQDDEVDQEDGVQPDAQYDEEEDEESDVNDFIVDEDDQPLRRKKNKKKSTVTHSDPALQEARDIFGVDFDYLEFEQDAQDDQEEDEETTTVKKSKRKSTAVKVIDLYEPGDLKKALLTEEDQQIRQTDIPERMQLRSIPIIPVTEGSTELVEEAEWIYKKAFSNNKLLQEVVDYSSYSDSCYKGPETVEKIRNALILMRVHYLEVPFIAFYRKELVTPELNINDLWTVYKFDAKWCALRQRRENLLKLFESMRDYQLEEIMKDSSALLPDDMRIIKDQDIERVLTIDSEEERKDLYDHFILYYDRELPKLREIFKQKRKEAKRLEREAKRLEKQAELREQGLAEDVEDSPEIEEEEEEDDLIKQPARTGRYSIYRRAGLCSFAKKFGLTPEHFAENVRDNYQRYEVEQESIEPSVIAEDYLGSNFERPEQVLEAVKSMVAIQIAREPLIRKCARELYMERAKISVRPTKKGIKNIDESHPVYTVKYLKDKPVRDLVDHLWLKLLAAQADDLVTITFSDTVEGTMSSDFIGEFTQLYIRDEFSKNVQEWNDLRKSCVEMAFKNFVIPELQKELKTKMTTEAKDSIMSACRKKLFSWLKFAPFTDDKFDKWDDKNEWNSVKGYRALGISYVPDFKEAAYASIVSPIGECVNYLKLANLLKRKNSFNQHERTLKETDMLELKDFIKHYKPHVIVVAAESRDASMICDDVEQCIKELQEEMDYPTIQIKICDTNVAKVFASSNSGVAEFREYPPILRESISLARRVQDPLREFSRLCNDDNDIICLNFHPLQGQLDEQELLTELQFEFVNRVNEVGVDLFYETNYFQSHNLMQFICGLGPRKSHHILRVLKYIKTGLENRSQIVTNLHMGPIIFMNCAGFIKIDVSNPDEKSDVYMEVLDSTRIHPEAYDWARKMAGDALEYDDQSDPHLVATAVEKIMEDPSKLEDLDLEAFAVELKRQEFGEKLQTLYNIREELTEPYKDLRIPYEQPSVEETFTLFTKETQETFYVGKLVQATVIGFRYKKPENDQLDQTNPIKNMETGMWQCPFCLNNDFPELSEVWNHFDAQKCPGKAVGVRLRLDNGLSGYIHVKNLSDKRVENPEERVRINQVISCRITKVDMEKFSGECTSKSSDLADVNNTFRPSKDMYYDNEAEEDDKRSAEESQNKNKKQTYLRRVIVHPQFYNITFEEAEKMLKDMPPGECVIRPSSRGTDKLSITWKVVEDIYQHIIITEKDKANDFSLGRCLEINDMKFEDLDEIIARYINVMAGYVTEVLRFKYYDGEIKEKHDADVILKEQKKADPKNIPYLVWATKKYPGKFVLSYVPRDKSFHEYFSVTADGFEFRGQKLDSFEDLIRWFKKNFRTKPVVQRPVNNFVQRPITSSVPYTTPDYYATPNCTPYEFRHMNMI